MNRYDVLVIGGGPAGLAAAIEARREGAERILVLERDRELGGILQQCVHNGFGLRVFKEELTGPEYAERFIGELRSLEIEYRLGCMVTALGGEPSVTAVSPDRGIERLEASALVLAMGCRERSRGALAIPGSRPAGVLTAGAAQRYVNVEGYLPGKDVVILGSGDIGLIMARRMTLEGARVHAVAELQPYSSGLARNLVQCLDDYGIPLLLSHTVTEIRGKDRLEAVVIQSVDEARRPVAGTERVYPCDTLLLSVGLVPENELSRKAGVAIDPRTGGPLVDEAMETSVPGVFACGNVVHVHDLVDYVTEEARKAGRSAARRALGAAPDRGRRLEVRPEGGVSYVVAQSLRDEALEGEVELFLRVKSVYRDAEFILSADGKPIKSFRKRIAAPGEMQRLAFDPSIVKGRGYATLRVEVR